jgi:hypothetical protein
MTFTARKVGGLAQVLVQYLLISVKYPLTSPVLYHPHMPVLFPLDRYYRFTGMIFEMKKEGSRGSFNCIESSLVSGHSF